MAVEPVVSLDNKAWVDSLLLKLNEIVTKQGSKVTWVEAVTGNSVVVAITPELVELIQENRAALVAVGLELFKSFLALMEKEQTVEALEAVYDKLDNNALLAQYEMDSAKLASLVAESEAQKKFWISLAEQLAIKLLPVALGALL